jgi:hypothetical protein
MLPALHGAVTLEQKRSVHIKAFMIKTIVSQLTSINHAAVQVQVPDKHDRWYIYLLYRSGLHCNVEQIILEIEKG